MTFAKCVWSREPAIRDVVRRGSLSVRGVGSVGRALGFVLVVPLAASLMAGCGGESGSSSMFAGHYVLDAARTAEWQSSDADEGSGSRGDSPIELVSASARVREDGTWDLTVDAKLRKSKWSYERRKSVNVIEDVQLQGAGAVTSSGRWIAVFGRHDGLGTWTRDGNRYLFFRAELWSDGTPLGTSAQYAEISVDGEFLDLHLYGSGGLFGGAWKDDLHITFRRE